MKPDARFEFQMSHYYGDIVRLMFVASAVLMLFALPFFQERIEAPVILSIAAILGLVVVAGLVNPRQKLIAEVSVGVALAGFLVFEFYAVSRFAGLSDPFFLVNQTVAVLFFIALYFGVKTMRGMFLYR